MRFLISALLGLLCLWPIILPAASADASKGVALSVETQKSSAELLDYAILADSVSKLAGLKLVLHYDTAQVTYKAATQTEATSGMMHIVNDKDPGKIIVVMAAATGISGQNLKLVRLSFIPKQPGKDAKKLPVTIASAELMGEDLQPIDWHPAP